MGDKEKFIMQIIEERKLKGGDGFITFQVSEKFLKEYLSEIYKKDKTDWTKICLSEQCCILTGFTLESKDDVKDNEVILNVRYRYEHG